jgi:hypothetical protein
MTIVALSCAFISQPGITVEPGADAGLLGVFFIIHHHHYAGGYYEKTSLTYPNEHAGNSACMIIVLHERN